MIDAARTAMPFASAHDGCDLTPTVDVSTSVEDAETYGPLLQSCP